MQRCVGGQSLRMVDFFLRTTGALAWDGAGLGGGPLTQTNRLVRLCSVYYMPFISYK